MSTSTARGGRAEPEGLTRMDFYGLLEQIGINTRDAVDALVDEREGDFRRAVNLLASHAAMLAADVRDM